jgi:hypothetical protein
MSYSYNIDLFKHALASLKEAATQAVIKEAQTRYGTKPTFPKDDAGVTALFEHLDKLVPQSVQSQGTGKQIYFFLLKQLFMYSPPGFVLGEDDFRVAPLMNSYLKAAMTNKLQGNAKNLDHYRSLEQLEEALENLSEEKNAPKPAEKDENESTYSEAELQIIQKGAKIVKTLGDWVLWKVPKSNNAASFEAAKRLCDNKRYNVKWCVGRGAASTYIPRGDFFVLAKGGRSTYAISSDDSSLTIWNPADTPIFSTGSRGYGQSEEISIPSLLAAGKKAGISQQEIKGIMAQFSLIPEDIIPILSEARKTEKTLQKIPEGQLVQADPEDRQLLYKVMHYVDPSAFVDDLNKLYSYRTVIQAHMLMSAAVSSKVQMKFTKQNFIAMDLYCMLGYLEAYAGTGAKSPEPELDELLVEFGKQWLAKLRF